MRINWHIALSIVALVVVWLMVFRYCSGPSSKGSILGGSEFCRTVALPEFWEKSTGEVKPTLYANFEYRKASSNSEGWCLVHKDLYTETRSSQMLCVTQEGSIVSPIDPDWNQWPIFELQRGIDLSDESMQQYERFQLALRRGVFLYSTVSVRALGSKWIDDVNPSKDLRFVILSSCDEDNWLERATSFKLSWGGNASFTESSPVYLQVVDLSTGKGIVDIKYKLNRSSVFNIINNVGWLDNRTFVSSDQLDGKVIICTLPE